ncbi:MAG: tRNA lysidine(34) synthetase TilS, partial [Catenibacillus sp.]|nr:tRNA lysidine(34) synthetase TilS [Catenibacillus sp.]
GDYMTIKGGYQKTVARLMIDDKVPGTLRDRLWLLADGHHVLWIPSADGGRISEHYKIEETTKHVLMIKIKGESDDGRQD